MDSPTPEQIQTESGNPRTIGETVRMIGSKATDPAVHGYSASMAAFERINIGILARNIGGLLGSVIGVREGAHPIRLEGKPAKIEILTQKSREK
jgi:hypothetical protein